MPNSVRKVLTNTNLTGIHNTIGNILTTEEKYVKALNTAISSNKNIYHFDSYVNDIDKNAKIKHSEFLMNRSSSYVHIVKYLLSL